MLQGRSVLAKRESEFRDFHELETDLNRQRVVKTQESASVTISQGRFQPWDMTQLSEFKQRLMGKKGNSTLSEQYHNKA